MYTYIHTYIHTYNVSMFSGGPHRRGASPGGGRPHGVRPASYIYIYIYVYTYIHMFIYIYTYISISLSLSLIIVELLVGPNI